MRESEKRGSRRVRTAGAVLAWLAAAAAATVVSSLAVGAIGSGLLPSAEPPLRPDEVSARLAATSAAPVATTMPATSAVPPAPEPSTPSVLPDPTVLSSKGGIVLARCAPGPVIVSARPEQGYGVKDIEPEDGGQRVRFESGKVRIEVLVTCQNGVPRAAIRSH